MAKNFLNEIHTIEKHQPFAKTFSAFKAVLSPSGGYLNIQLKVKYEFPMGWRLLNPTMSQDAFKKALADMVDNVWSGRYAIVIQGNDDKRKARVLPSVSIVEAGDDAHFTIDVQRLGSGRSWVDNGNCKFYSGAINYKPSALAMKLGYKLTFGEWSHDRLIYRDAEAYTKRALEGECKYKPSSLDPVNPLKFKTLADAMKEHADVWPLLPLKLTGYRLASEPMLLSRQRAEDFQKRLRMAGAPNSVIEIADGGVCNSPDGRPYVKVEVKNTQSAFLQQANNFPIAAHEIGHMLGLCDEYDDAADAAAINAYARGADVNLSVPPFSSNTSSLMSQGDKLLPYHYVTFHQTIMTMVANFAMRNPDGINRLPTVKIQESLLRDADPTVQPNLDLTWLFPPAEGGV